MIKFYSEIDQIDLNIKIKFYWSFKDYAYLINKAKG